MVEKNLLFNILGIYLETERQKIDEDDLKKGFRLEPTNVKMYKNDSTIYSHLYKDGVKVSDEYFRKGGLCSGFKGNYCQLIKYNIKEGEGLGSMGLSCIVNLEGKIVFTSKGILTHPYLQGGIIVVEDSTYYNLETGLPIVKGSSNLKSNNFIFVENSYNKEFEIGVYKIELKSGKVEIFK